MAKGKFATVKTPLGDKLLLRKLTGREELGRPFSYSLELLSEDDQIKAAPLLGQGVSVQLLLDNDQSRFIHGLVVSFACTGTFGRYTAYRAQLRPFLFLLQHTSDCRIFQQETIPDILKKVFAEHGFSDVELELEGTYKQLEYVVQYRETTLNFVTRLMERVGIYYYFKHEADKHTLVLADCTSAHAPAPGYESVGYYPQRSSRVRGKDHFQSWHLEHQFCSGAYAINEFDFKRPKADLNAKSVAPLDHARAELELYDYPGAYEQSDDGEALAKVRLQAAQAQFEHVRAEGNVRGLNAGHLFKLENFKREDQNRQYLLVSVESQLEVNGYESGTADASSYGCTVVAIDAEIPYRLPIVTPKPVVMGPQTAIVTGKEGEEI